MQGLSTGRYDRLSEIQGSQKHLIQLLVFHMPLSLELQSRMLRNRLAGGRYLLPGKSSEAFARAAPSRVQSRDWNECDQYTPPLMRYCL
jgi:hypothetical protein